MLKSDLFSEWHWQIVGAQWSRIVCFHRSVLEKIWTPLPLWHHTCLPRFSFTNILEDCACFISLNTNARGSSEMPVATYNSTWCHNTDDHILNFDYCEKLKSLLNLQSIPELVTGCLKMCKRNLSGKSKRQIYKRLKNVYTYENVLKKELNF